MPLLYSMYQQPFWTVFGLALVGLWTLVWKGVSLWHAGKNQQKNWFIALLILNTAGLLPIIYLLWFKPEGADAVKKVVKKTQKTDKKVNEDKVIEISEDNLNEDVKKEDKKEDKEKVSVKKKSKKTKVSGNK